MSYQKHSRGYDSGSGEPYPPKRRHEEDRPLYGPSGGAAKRCPPHDGRHASEWYDSDRTLNDGHSLGHAWDVRPSPPRAAVPPGGGGFKSSGNSKGSGSSKGCSSGALPVGRGGGGSVHRGSGGGTGISSGSGGSADVIGPGYRGGDPMVLAQTVAELDDLGVELELIGVPLIESGEAWSSALRRLAGAGCAPLRALGLALDASGDEADQQELVASEEASDVSWSVAALQPFAAERDSWRKLKSLCLRRLPLVSGAALHVIGSLTQLRALRIEDAPRLPADAAAELQELSGLRLLSFCGNTAMGNACVGYAMVMPELHALHLDDTACDDVAVLTASVLPKLVRLSMRRTAITDHGLRVLAKRCCLTALDIAGCKQLTDEGISLLTAQTHIQHLDLADCPLVSSERRARLEHALRASGALPPPVPPPAPRRVRVDELTSAACAAAHRIGNASLSAVPPAHGGKCPSLAPAVGAALGPIGSGAPGPIGRTVDANRPTGAPPLPSTQSTLWGAPNEQHCSPPALAAGRWASGCVGSVGGADGASDGGAHRVYRGQAVPSFGAGAPSSPPQLPPTHGPALLGPDTLRCSAPADVAAPFLSLGGNTGTAAHRSLPPGASAVQGVAMGAAELRADDGPPTDSRIRRLASHGPVGGARGLGNGFGNSGAGASSGDCRCASFGTSFGVGGFGGGGLGGIEHNSPSAMPWAPMGMPLTREAWEPPPSAVSAMAITPLVGPAPEVPSVNELADTISTNSLSVESGAGGIVGRKVGNTSARCRSLS